MPVARLCPWRKVSCRAHAGRLRRELRRLTAMVNHPESSKAFCTVHAPGHTQPRVYRFFVRGLTERLILPPVDVVCQNVLDFDDRVLTKKGGPVHHARTGPSFTPATSAATSQASKPAGSYPEIPAAITATGGIRRAVMSGIGTRVRGRL